MTVLALLAPVELVTVELKRTTGAAVPATGECASAHDVVSVSEISGPLELLASFTK